MIFFLAAAFFLLPSGSVDAWAFSETLVALGIFVAFFPRIRERGLPLLPAFVFWSLFLVWATASGFWAAEHRGEFLIEVRRLWIPALAAWALAASGEEGRGRIRAAILASSLGLACWVLSERFTGTPRPSGPWLNPNMTASVLGAAGLYALPVFGRFLGSSRGPRAFLAGAGLGLIFGGAGVAASRGVSIALTAALALGWFLRRRTGSSDRRRLFRYLALAGILGLFLLPSIKRLSGAPQGDHLAYARLLIYPAVVKMAVDHPGTGVGWGQFGFHYGAYKDPAVGMYEASYPHSAWLHVLVETGFLGLAFLALGWVLSLRDLGRRISEAPPDQGDWASGARMGIIFLLIHAVVDENMAMMGPAFLGLALSLEAGRDRGPRVGPGKAAALALLIFFWSLAARTGLGHFAKGQEALIFGKDREAESEFILAASSLPYLSAPLLGLAQLQVRAGRTGEALAFVEKALGFAPRDQEARSASLRIHAYAGDFAGAQREAHALIGLDPHNPLLRTRVAGMLEEAGDRVGAVLQLEEALRLMPDWAEAAEALRRLKAGG